MIRRYCKIGYIIFIICFISSHSSFAENQSIIFEKNILYDIYYKEINSFGIYKISGVTIDGFVNINGYDFLIVRKMQGTFKDRKTSPGYLRFDTAIAVLPSNESFDVENLNRPLLKELLREILQEQKP